MFFGDGANSKMGCPICGARRRDNGAKFPMYDPWQAEARRAAALAAQVRAAKERAQKLASVARGVGPPIVDWAYHKYLINAVVIHLIMILLFSLRFDILTAISYRKTRKNVTPVFEKNVSFS